MALITMYPGQFGSPATSLGENIDSIVDVISVVNAAVLPDAPNLATIGAGDTLEVILYTEKSGNNLTGVTRGFGGSAAQSWDEGEEIGRFYTTYDHNTFRSNIIDFFNKLGANNGIALLDGSGNVHVDFLNATYANLRAQATTKDDVGLGNVDNMSSLSIRIHSGTELRLEIRTSDPSSPAVGRIWLRSDL